MGTPPQSPARAVSSSDMFATGRPPLRMSASPRAPVIMPRVTMKGATPPLVTSTPFTNPQVAPVRRPTAMGMMTGWSPGCAKVAQATPLRATTEPRERSTPPVSSTKVTPTARMPLMETCRATLVRFEAVAKLSVAVASKPEMSSSTATMPKRWIRLRSRVRRRAGFIGAWRGGGSPPGW